MNHLAFFASLNLMHMMTYQVSDFPLFPHFVLPLLPNQRL
ncbi:hypothetical protein ECDEC12A_2167 [Escherichia coli DEC12A]|nr:hypothetical protein ECDEC12B_2485 [Escherichia coli DEC12B]EHX31725.1 hypothetical protein ECDEC12A_2167 [Escherichia coli DEC12A]EHX47371.1 hypothetical protein ECDEC12D_2298 [Escherichia coli DEC12D]